MGTLWSIRSNQGNHMGTRHTAHCECGFKQEVSVGGPRRRANFPYFEYFPFYCGCCGLVNLSIAEEADRLTPKCPKCASTAVHQYGKAPASIPIARPPRLKLLLSRIAARLHRLNGRTTNTSTGAVEPNRSAFQWDGYAANMLDNRCPACKQMTLVFDPMPLVLFD